MWKEWLERTLARSAPSAPYAVEPCLYDAIAATLPHAANANEPEPPPPMSRVDAGECVDA
jgi:hypothetical protein